MGASADYWEVLWLTLRLALVTTVLLLIVGLPLALWTVRKGRKPGLIAETLFALPAVLSPAVIGFYLLILFTPHSWTGALWERIFGYPFELSFAGLIAGSFVYSLPFAVRPFRSAFSAVPRVFLDDARLNGASIVQTFWHIILPLSRRGIAAGVLLSFAHTIGGFGILLMIGGNFLSDSPVASVALYDELRNAHYGIAHAYAATLLVLALALIFAVVLLQSPEEGAK